MMERRSALAAIAALAASACVPMEQASLVYSASNTIGVDVEAGTPQSPGLLVTIGYRGLNAAYVPVLAAKNCPEHDAENCTDVAYHPIAIRGTSKEGNQSSSTDSAQIAQLSDGIVTRAGDIARLEQTIEQLTTKNERVDQLRADLRQLAPIEPEASKPGSQDETTEGAAEEPQAIDEDKTQRDVIEREIAALEPAGSTPLADQIATNTRRLEELRQAQADARARLSTAKENAQRDDKDDAYSVFGSFDGNAGGRSDGASLQVGQIFSTGIAAQNLTQRLSRVQCIGALHERTNGLAPDKYAELVNRVCGATADR